MVNITDEACEIPPAVQIHMIIHNTCLKWENFIYTIVIANNKEIFVVPKLNLCTERFGYFLTVTHLDTF